MSGTKSRLARKAAVSLAMVCLSVGLSAAPVSAEETTTVTGRVVRGDGGSVDQLDVQVSIVPDGAPFGRGFTVVKADVEGRFIIPNVPTDIQLLVDVPSPDEFLSDGTGFLRTPSQGGEVADLGDIILEHAGVVSGTITAAAGLPLTGEASACVIATAGGTQKFSYCSDQHGLTPGAKISYSISGVPPGTYKALVGGTRVGGRKWFDNATSLADATELTVTTGSTSANVDFSVVLVPDTFTSTGPSRIIETRPGRPDGAIKVAKSKIGPAQPLSVKLGGVADVPASHVAAASLVVTVTNPTEAGYVTVYPCGTRPTTSSVNFVAGQTVANAVVAPLSEAGDVCFFASTNTDLIVDVNGYLPANGGFIPQTPARLMETRAGRPADLANVSKTKVRPGATKRIDLESISGLGDAVMLSLNVTATGASQNGHVSVYACSSTGETTATSTVNFPAGSTVANAALVATSSQGGLCVSSSVPVDVVIDINGVFDRNTRLSTQMLDLAGGRVIDTRPGRPSVFGVSGKIGGEKILAIPGLVSGSSVYNVTVVAPGENGYITAYPCEQERPTTSNINFSKGVSVAGLVISGNSRGNVCMYSSTPVDLIVDNSAELDVTSAFG